jgi:hypothetical protein
LGRKEKQLVGLRKVACGGCGSTTFVEGKRVGKAKAKGGFGVTKNRNGVFLKNFEQCDQTFHQYEL